MTSLEDLFVTSMKPVYQRSNDPGHANQPLIEWDHKRNPDIIHLGLIKWTWTVQNKVSGFNHINYQFCRLRVQVHALSKNLHNCKKKHAGSYRLVVILYPRGENFQAHVFVFHISSWDISSLFKHFYDSDPTVVNSSDFSS